MLRRAEIEILPPRLLVSHYLLASFAYYWLNKSPMTDDAFDYLCVRLSKEWHSIEHGHKHLIDREALSAGTNLLPQGQYPQIIKATVLGYCTSCLDGTLAPVLHRQFGRPAGVVMRRTRAQAKESDPTPTVRVRRVRPAPAPEPEPNPTPRVRRTRPSA